MAESNVFNFNLPNLLRMTDMNVREVAKEKSELTMNEYFNALTLFLKKAPDLMEAMAKIADFETEVKDASMLNAVCPVFHAIGLYNLENSLTEIAKDCKRGFVKGAIVKAIEVTPIINNVVDKLSAAKRPPKTDAEGLFYGISLLEAIAQLVREDATRSLVIMAVDDTASMLKTYVNMLPDYKVYTVIKPRMLENALKNVTPDLFLLDYLMPDLNGFELLPIIRGMEEHETTPVIYVTSEGSVEHVSAALFLGAADFVIKPVQEKVLRAKVAKHIVKKPLF